MVRIEMRESALTAEILDDEFHQRCKLIFQESERESYAQVFDIPGLDIWLIVKSV